MKRHAPPNAGIPCPKDYIEMMRHYLPRVPLAFIKLAWRHAATVTEVQRHLERVEGGAA